MMMDNTMIPISKETRSRLKWICFKGQTYDHIINLLIDFTTEISNDKEFRGWVRKKIDEEIIHEKEKELNSIGMYTGTPNHMVRSEGD